jgi:hypothetical protein
LSFAHLGGGLFIVSGSIPTNIDEDQIEPRDDRSRAAILREVYTLPAMHEPADVAFLS